VKAAVGVEYLLTKYAQTNTNATTHARLAPVKASTKPKSVFGELNIPIFSEQNRRPGFESLTLAGSARYDDYNEVGTTFNYKVAMTWEPIKTLTLRGNYGTSFRAPTAVNKIGPAANALSCSVSSGTLTGCLTSGFFFPLPPGAPAPAVQTVGLALIGGNEVSTLKPETAKNWSVGADFRPSFIPGLSLSATYYHINLSSVIGIPSTGQNGRLDLIYTNAPQLFFCGPSSPTVTLPPCDAAAIAAVAALAPNNGATVLAQIAGKTVAYISDTRTVNLGEARVGGIDAEVNYYHPFSWGSVDLNVNGTWRLKSTSAFFPGGVPVDELLTGTPTFRMTSTAGIRYGGLRAQVTWLHQSGFKLLAATTRLASQTHASATDFFNLSFRYTVNSSFSLLKDLQLTATINNVFDKKEQINLTTTGGIIGGSTLGRFFQFGISKSFGAGSRDRDD
jgi:iron complex outermembrane receptor protein